METNCQESVTISLEKYESMKSEIQSLKKEVEKNTIIKYYSNPTSFMYGFMGAFVICLIIAIISSI